jgi:hypothetical protein
MLPVQDLLQNGFLYVLAGLPQDLSSVLPMSQDPAAVMGDIFPTKPLPLLRIPGFIG